MNKEKKTLDGKTDDELKKDNQKGLNISNV